MLPPSPLTDPDVQISRFRFFMEELRSQDGVADPIRDSLVEKVEHADAQKINAALLRSRRSRGVGLASCEVTVDTDILSLLGRL